MRCGRFSRSLAPLASALIAIASLGTTGCQFEAHMGSGPVGATNWQSGSTGVAPAPAPLPNVPPPQPQPQPQPQPPTQPGPRRIAHIPKPTPTGGTTTFPVPIARNTGLFGSGNEHSALRGLVYFIPESTMSFPDVSNMKPSALVYTDTLNVEARDYQEGVAGTNRFEFYAIQFDGKFTVANAGKYTFVLTSSDGSKLYIDDKLVVDNDQRHTPLRKFGDIDLSAGPHTIRVDYFKAYRWVIQLQLTVIPAGGTERLWTATM